MSDKTDPRLMRLDTALGSSADGFYVAADALLADLDAADRAAGIVRVDTRDDALVERLARVLCDTVCSCPDRDDKFLGLCCTCDARAVRDMLREES